MRDSSRRNHRSPLSRGDAGRASGTFLTAAYFAAAENRISLAASARITPGSRAIRTIACNLGFIRRRFFIRCLDALRRVSSSSSFASTPSASPRRFSVREERFQQLFLFFSRATSPTSIRRADKIDFSLAKRRRRRLQRRRRRRRRRRRKRRMEYLRAPPRHFRFLRQSLPLSFSCSFF